ncbi:uncharacterized protein [Triticum aestivum]|uniref:uncharacterized protein isoform X2 n=2 Tax=Triticum aestivum TaxID=4565 RepID=UPI001D02AB9C|nr:uncharacterized protein LOC123124424 isoform X2 [Triticum aestivum]
MAAAFLAGSERDGAAMQTMLGAAAAISGQIRSRRRGRGRIMFWGRHGGDLQGAGGGPAAGLQLQRAPFRWTGPPTSPVTPRRPTGPPPPRPRPTRPPGAPDRGRGFTCGGAGDCCSLGEERAAKVTVRTPMTTCRTSHCRRGCPSRWFSPSQRLNIRGRVYPAMLPVDGNKVPGKVWKGITDGEFNVLDTFEDEQYVREVVGISLTDSADTMMAYAYIWGNVDDPDLYSEWDFDVDGPADARDLGSPSPFGSSLSFMPSYRGARDQRPDASMTELLCCCLRSSRLVLGPSHPSSRSDVLCPFFRLMVFHDQGPQAKE